MSLPPLVVPGQLLGPISKYALGPGTHQHENNIYASLAGRPHVSHASSSPAGPGSGHSLPANPPAGPGPSLPTVPVSQLPTISIPRLLPSPTSAPIPSSAISNSNTLPFVGAEVLCRVTRLTARQVDVRILQVGGGGGQVGGGQVGAGGQVVDGGQVGDNGGGQVSEGQVCGDEWAGVVRREDVRATEKDRVKVAEGFRVGDLVRGVVISLGDQSNYYLTTATNDLGVIMARSEAGNEMVPVSWKEFMDPITGLKESRKVAKPI